MFDCASQIEEENRFARGPSGKISGNERAPGVRLGNGLLCHARYVPHDFGVSRITEEQRTAFIHPMGGIVESCLRNWV